MADQPGRPSFPVAVTAPLVGRAREQGVLRDTLAAALAGHGALVLIGGEAGSGKTALAEALLAEAAAQAALVLVGRCYDLAETPPYGPWLEVTARYPASPDLPPLPPVVTDRAALATVASQAALFVQVGAWFAAVAAARPLVLLLDDLHWGDPASLDLLRVLGRQLADLPLLLLVTYRSDELTRRHPLSPLLPVLEREAQATRLDLRPLDTAALRALVGRYALPDADAARLAAWLAERAEGNAFFTTQLLRALEEDGTLRPATTGGALGDLTGVGLPAPLRQVLDARVDRLGEATRHRLTLAAVIGQAVPLALWAVVAETDEDDLLDTVDAAAGAQLVAVAPDGTAIRFVHALIREALYAGLVATRRRRVHRRVAEALLATASPDPDAVAFHFQRAGDPRAADWLVRAGERAERAYAWLTAGERYEAALALLEDDATTAGRRALLLVHLAQMRRYADPERGAAYLEEAVRLATVAGDTALAACALFDQGHLRCLAEDQTRGLAQMAEALPVLEALPATERAGLPTLTILGVPPAEREHYHRGSLVQHLAHVGRFAEARAASERPGRVPGRTTREVEGLAVMYALLGEPERARENLAAATATLRAARQHHEVGTALWIELAFAVLPYQADQPTERRRLATEAAAAWTRGGGTQAAPARVLALPVLALEGDWAEARQVALVTRETARGMWRLFGTLFLGPLARAQGDADLAGRCVADMLPAGLATAPGAVHLVAALAAQQLAAALALDAGDLAAAQAWLAAHDRWLAWSGAVLGLAEGHLGWAAYHCAAGDHEQAYQHVAAALRHATTLRQPLVLLAAHRALGELATAVGQQAEAQDHLAQALVLAEACAAPYERALTLLVVAARHAATGDREAARAALHQARTILGPLEARPALARAEVIAARLAAAPGASVAAPGLPAGLSAREAEVLRLVAGGLTNAQVAARLFLSSRTIDHHLRTIYGKIGVDNRTAAARFATEHGLA